MKNMYIYIVTNHPYGALYVGVTNNLVRRIYEHKNKIMKGFTCRYGLNKLVYYEVFDSEIEAIKREKTLKRWLRDWKIDLVNKFNPDWKDLYSDITK